MFFYLFLTLVSCCTILHLFILFRLLCPKIDRLILLFVWLSRGLECTDLIFAVDTWLCKAGSLWLGPWIPWLYKADSCFKPRTVSAQKFGHPELKTDNTGLNMGLTITTYFMICLQVQHSLNSNVLVDDIRCIPLARIVSISLVSIHFWFCAIDSLATLVAQAAQIPDLWASATSAILALLGRERWPRLARDLRWIDETVLDVYW